MPFVLYGNQIVFKSDNNDALFYKRKRELQFLTSYKLCGKLQHIVAQHNDKLCFHYFHQDDRDDKAETENTESDEIE